MPADASTTPRQARLGALVKTYREEAGLTQERLAWKAGIDRSYVPQIESGRRNLTLDMICVLAVALDVDAADLVKGCQKERGKPRPKRR